MSEDFRSSRGRNRRNLVILGLLILIGISGLAAVSIRSAFVGESLPQGAVARIEEKQGEILIKRSGVTIPFEEGFLLRSGDTIRTKKASSLRIHYLQDATQILVEPETSILFDSNKGGKKVRISGGKATFMVPEQPKEQPMVLASNCAEATVLQSGTFTLIMHGLQAHYQVDSGRLRIRRLRDAQKQMVNAGESFTTSDAAGRIEFGAIDDTPLRSQE